MKILEDTGRKPDMIAITMNLKEGQDLVKALEHVTNPGSPLRKNSNAWKIAKRLVDDLPVFTA